ncbi:MAG: phage holin family protein [Alphaproteobacteria bacterium]|nr:phage holin family protein [Alphaproteobacteria bacterium]MBV9372552.1 phage holin family protein [Alphaproteobacteria bacterium]MBV9899902.1 phage holin family protein [Alphaproteobacteria bacterium]
MLDGPTSSPGESSIGELFGKLAEDGKAYLRAEANLYRTVAMRRVGLARNGAIALAAAFLLLNAALIALLVGFAMQLAKLVGPALGGLIVFAVVAVLGFVLVRYGAAKLGALGGDEEERAALAGGEKTG